MNNIFRNVDFNHHLGVLSIIFVTIYRDYIGLAPYLSYSEVG